MADNTLLNSGTGGDSIRSVDRSGSGPKTQVIQLDFGAAGAGNEALLTAGSKAPSASLPVTLANDVVVGAAASIAALNVDLLTGTASGWYDAANFHSVSIQIVGSAGITAGAITFEQTNDTTAASAGNLWAVEETTSLTPTPNIAAITIAASTTRMFAGAVMARYVRVRVSTAFATANVQAIAVFSQLPYQRTVQTVHQATAANLTVTASGTVGVTGYPTAAASADALANPTVTKVDTTTLNFNGTSWDRARNNALITMGDTGAKTATFNGATQTNYNARGAYITVAVGAVTGTTPTLACQLQVSYDGTNFINLGPASANITTSTQTCTFVVYPTNLSQSAGATPANLTTGANQTIAINAPLPRTWRIAYTIGGTTPSFTLTNAYAAYVN